MSRKVEDEESISDILYAVHSITVNDSICKDMTERGNTARMIELLDRFAADSPKLALLACRCVTALANNDGNKQVVCRSGGVEGILKMLSCTRPIQKFRARASLALDRSPCGKLTIAS